jgi:hypothetical protein
MHLIKSSTEHGNNARSFNMKQPDTQQHDKQSGKNEATRGPKNACPVSSTAFIQRTVPNTRLP